MNVTSIAQMLFLLAAANGAPVLAKWSMGDRFSAPLDGGAAFSDGRPIFGPSKTTRGVVLSLAVTALITEAMGQGWALGALIAAAAMAGDLLSSFVKRRMGLPSSAMALVMDQTPEALLPALVAMAPMKLDAADVLATVILFFAGELILSRVLYALKIREQPY
jgi:CDP-2,3-bis-(O-geranylgeranyl)-sn-glycerol synthase